MALSEGPLPTPRTKEKPGASLARSPRELISVHQIFPKDLTPDEFSHCREQEATYDETSSGGPRSPLAKAGQEPERRQTTKDHGLVEEKSLAQRGWI